MTMSEEDLLEVHQYSTVEITLTDPLTESEVVYLVDQFDRKDYECVVNQSGRILLVATDELEDVLQLLGRFGYLTSVGLIRVIMEFEPQWDELSGQGFTLQ